MISLKERQTLIDIAYQRGIYGSTLPTRINERWVCPHCRFGHGEIEKIAAHLAESCDESKSKN